MSLDEYFKEQEKNKKLATLKCALYSHSDPMNVNLNRAQQKIVLKKDK